MLYTGSFSDTSEIGKLLFFWKVELIALIDFLCYHVVYSYKIDGLVKT